MKSSAPLLTAGLLLSAVYSNPAAGDDARTTGREGSLVQGENEGIVDGVISEIQKEQKEGEVPHGAGDATVEYRRERRSSANIKRASGSKIHRRKKHQGATKAKKVRASQSDLPGENAERFRSMFNTAKQSISRVSRRMYAKGEDYWNDPRRSRALGYIAVVAILIIIVAYAEHREQILSIEIEELEQRQSMVALMEKEIAEELMGLRKDISEGAATREAQVQHEKGLQYAEENLKKEREILRDRMAGLQQEQLNLSVREAKAQLSATPQDMTKGIEGAQTALDTLKEIKEAANKLFWQGDILRTGGAPPAMSDQSLLEASVRAQYRTMQRVMALEEIPFSLHETILKMLQKLSDEMTTLELHLHSALRMLKDDAWVARAEKRLLRDPDCKARLLKGLDAEWASEKLHQVRLWQLQDQQRVDLQKIRQELQEARRMIADELNPLQRNEYLRRLFILSSRELYREGILRVMDAEVATHKHQSAWYEKMKGLIDEAEIRANERKQAWGTTTAAAAELTGKIQALEGLMESLDDKVEECLKIHKTWRDKWGIHRFY